MNKKGYMLIEIILASVIAFGVAVFIVTLVIKLKNKNDDTLVDTLTVTDTSIVSNKLMEYAVNEKGEFKCDKLVIEDNRTLKYDEEVLDVFNDYATPSISRCDVGDGEVSVYIKVDVPQMPGEDYDVKFNYKYRIDDVSYPILEVKTISPETNGWAKTGKAKVTISDSNGLANGVYTIKYGWGTSKVSCDNMKYSGTITISNNAHEGSLEEISIDSEHGAGSGKGKIYVCNETEIKDMNGNALPSSVSSDAMWLDNTPPTCQLGNISGNGRITFKKKIDIDSGVDTTAYGITLNNATPTYDTGSANEVDRQPTYSCGRTFRGFLKDNVGNEGMCRLDAPVCEPDPPPDKSKCCTQYVWTCCTPSGGGSGSSGGSSGDSKKHCAVYNLAEATCHWVDSCDGYRYCS